MANWVTLLLFLFSIKSNGQDYSFRDCFVYSGEMRRINSRDKMLYNQELRRNHLNASLGATEILVKQVSSGDTLWIALTTDIKNVSLPKRPGVHQIKISGLRIRGGAKNILIANAIKTCK